MKYKIMTLTATMAMAGMISNNAAFARDEINIVGSSTVFPFATAVAEKFGQKGSFKTPKVEATGSGGGIKLFCKGVGKETPDVANSSRRIKKTEFEMCQSAGVKDIVEVMIGYDGIVLANAKSGADFNITLDQVYKALAAMVPGKDGKLIPNPYKNWSDIDPSLPNQKIEVLGPPPTSGTRDAFEELAMQAGAKKIEWIADLAKLKEGDAKIAEMAKKYGIPEKFLTKKDKPAKGEDIVAQLGHIRSDGAYIESGENDNLIVSKLEQNANAVGVFGFSFLEQNADKLKGSKINGKEPTFDNIVSTDYKVSRSLYFYVKKAHVGVISGLKEYVQEFVSDSATGKEGYLVAKGLITLQDEKHNANKTIGDTLPAMTADGLK